MNSFGTTDDTNGKKVRFLPPTWHKNLFSVKDLNVKSKTLKLSEENIKSL